MLPMVTYCQSAKYLHLQLHPLTGFVFSCLNYSVLILLQAYYSLLKKSFLAQVCEGHTMKKCPWCSLSVILS